MEIANLKSSLSSPAPLVRRSQFEDIHQINYLVQTTSTTHLHIDWALPAEWVGRPTFVVAEQPQAAYGKGLVACLAATADPPPAAWIRLAAVADGVEPLPLLQAMLAQVLPALQREGVVELGWFVLAPGVEQWLPALGFSRRTQVITYVKKDLSLPEIGTTAVPTTTAVQIRPVQNDDMAELAAIEAEAFEPLWRHSVNGLRAARHSAISFDVAVLDGRIVAFQYSTAGEVGAHLSRLTVRPEVQGQGVGSALLQAAIEEYGRQGFRQVALNTQVDNTPSRRLYEKFGFKVNNDAYPVWVRRL
jgi:ribosomal protein S18 acetylase RimI-like enzyme